MKFLLISVITFIILFRLISFFFRILINTSGRYQPQDRHQQYQGRSAKNGDIHVDYNTDKRRKKRGSDFKGGEYVDYEEVE